MQLNEIIIDCLPYSIAKKCIAELGKKSQNISLQNPVYSKTGRRLESIYIQDNSFAHTPHAFTIYQIPSYLIWDRQNSYLPVHAYTNEEIFYCTGVPRKKFAFFYECEYVLPRMYEKIYRDLGCLREFDAVFTNQERMLNSLPNAHYNFGYGTWYDTPFGGGKLDSLAYQKKSKMISIVSSAKTMCELHIVRKNLAMHFKRLGRVDCYGTFDGGAYVKCTEYLKDYRYHIAVENQTTKGYFTQKITDCFLAMTIPIYIGAINIGDYFNLDGIIVVKPEEIDRIDEIVKRCTISEYERRIPAIIDNYNRVQKYKCMEDYMVETYPAFFI